MRAAGLGRIPDQLSGGCEAVGRAEERPAARVDRAGTPDRLPLGVDKEGRIAVDGLLGEHGNSKDIIIPAVVFRDYFNVSFHVIKYFYEKQRIFYKITKITNNKNVLSKSFA